MFDIFYMANRNRRNRQPQKPVGIDLKIDIKDFGPISKGTIQLKPLTIFIGPNNSGKSYVAILIHSILTSQNLITESGRSRGFTNPQFRTLHRSFHQDLKKFMKQIKHKESFDIPVNITKKTSATIIRDLGVDLESEIARNFGTPVNHLVRKKQKHATISVSNSKKFDISINKKLTLKTNSKLDVKYKIRTRNEQTDYVDGLDEQTDPQTIYIPYEPSNNLFDTYVTTALLHSIRNYITHDAIPSNSYYFPAAGSGILQGHKVLSAGMMTSVYDRTNQNFKTPRLVGTVSDFLSNILVMDNARGSYFDLAQQLESELFHGNIQLPSNTTDPFAEITYNSEYNKIPLDRASSSISEIAPLSLYLKHIVHSGSLLIIEEPEAHLHPANQLIFAKYIVRMIRSGLHVLVITHSVFLLEQLGQFLLAGKISSDVRKKKLGLGINDFLLHDEVSPYLFVKKDDNDHKIVPLEINYEDGISQEEFVKINAYLYSKHIKLQKNLDVD